MGRRNKKAKQELGIDEGDMKGEKTTVKHRVNKKIKEWFKERIEKESKNKSKVQHLLEGIKNRESQERANYMKKLTRPQASTIVKARSRMLPVKNQLQE